MHSVISSSARWSVYCKIMERLYSSYIQSKSQELNPASIKKLIELYNQSRMYVSPDVPTHALYFLPDYLILVFLGKETVISQDDIIGFLDFLVKNNAFLEGIEVVKDELIRKIYQSEPNTDFLNYLLVNRDLKLEDPIALIVYAGEKEKTVRFQIQYEMERYFLLEKSAAKLTIPVSTKNYVSAVHFRPNSWVYMRDSKQFYFMNHAGRVALNGSMPTVPT